MALSLYSCLFRPRGFRRLCPSTRRVHTGRPDETDEIGQRFLQLIQFPSPGLIAGGKPLYDSNRQVEQAVTPPQRCSMSTPEGYSQNITWQSHGAVRHSLGIDHHSAGCIVDKSDHVGLSRRVNARVVRNRFDRTYMLMLTLFSLLSLPLEFLDEPPGLSQGLFSFQLIFLLRLYWIIEWKYEWSHTAQGSF